MPATEPAGGRCAARWRPRPPRRRPAAAAAAPRPAPSRYPPAAPGVASTGSRGRAAGPTSSRTVRVVTPSRSASSGAGPVPARRQQGQQPEQSGRGLQHGRQFPAQCGTISSALARTRRCHDRRHRRPAPPSPVPHRRPAVRLDDLHRRLADTRWPDDGRGCRRRGTAACRSATCRTSPSTGGPRTTGGRRRRSSTRSIPVHDHDRRPDHPLPARAVARARRTAAADHPRLPGSVAEFAELIGPLTDPRSPRRRPGGRLPRRRAVAARVRVLDPRARHRAGSSRRTTDAFAELMRRLGYDRYGAHGGDIGAGVTGRLAADAVPSTSSACT